MRAYQAGRLLGVPILIHPSLALICFPVGLWMSGAERYVASDTGNSASIALGFIGALIYCLSILLHESGHTVMARHFDLRVDSLTLNAWGGRIRGSASMPGPKVDAAVAAAGPAVTLLLIALGVGALVGLGTDGHAFAKAIALAVVILNLTLLPGCAIPIWPTDAARILRAVAWRRGGDLQAATRLTCLLGLLLIGLSFEAGAFLLLHPAVPGSQTAAAVLIGLAALLLPQAWSTHKQLRHAAELSAA